MDFYDPDPRNKKTSDDSDSSLGWVYLIRNGDLHKIGRTKNIERRIKQLKPDEVIAKVKTSNYEKFERQLHKQYKDVRIPQTEYFRLKDWQVIECKSQIKNARVKGSASDEEFDGWSGATALIFLFLIVWWFVSSILP